MNILAFDTCLGAVSAAVRGRRGDGTWLERGVAEVRERGQAERLLPMLAEVMAEAGLAFADLDRIAVTLGPGSFTGVRVGVAAARALALATGLPVVGATSLAVMAHQAFERLGPALEGRTLAVAADARRGMIHLQLFALGVAGAGEPLMLAVDKSPLAVEGRAVTVVGPAAWAVADAMAAAGRDAQAALAELQPDARALARMAAHLAPISPPRPLYLRPPDVRSQAAHSLPRALS
jgi:tRNA threonylcarbamoyladenosine biosynthesis protein TsaB